MVAAGVLVTALVLVVLGIFLYVGLRQGLESHADDVLVERVDLVNTLSRDLPSFALADRLSRSGVPARVRLPNGDDVVTTPEAAAPGRRKSHAVPLGDGGTADVYVSLVQVDEALSRLVRLEIVGGIAGLALVALALGWASRTALEPLQDVVATARRIAAGHESVRLRPANPRTDIGQLAASFDEMLDALEAAVRDARELSAFNERFLSDVAHQLRTPITGIRASAETLAMGARPATQERLLANLVAESDRAGRLLSALLRLARIDQGEAPDRRPSDLVALCRDEVERTREKAPQLRVLLDVDGETIEPLELDPASMREVLANLLDNATRHAVTRIGVTVRPHNGSVEIRVADDGAGMTDEAAERAFERFVSLDACGGSGLGLPIARGIVRAHGGDLTYERKTFVVRLPARAPGPPDENGQAEEEEEAAAAQDSERKT